MHAAVLMSAHPLHDDDPAQLLFNLRLLPLLPHIRGHCTTHVCALPSATAPPHQRLPTSLPHEPIIVDHPLLPSSSPGTPGACTIPPQHPQPQTLAVPSAPPARHLPPPPPITPLVITTSTCWTQLMAPQCGVHTLTPSHPHTCLAAAMTAARRFTCSFVQPLQSPCTPYAPHAPVSLLP